METSLDSVATNVFSVLDIFEQLTLRRGGIPPRTTSGTTATGRPRRRWRSRTPTTPFSRPPAAPSGQPERSRGGRPGVRVGRARREGRIEPGWGRASGKISRRSAREELSPLYASFVLGAFCASFTSLIQISVIPCTREQTSQRYAVILPAQCILVIFSLS